LDGLAKKGYITDVPSKHTSNLKPQLGETEMRQLFSNQDKKLLSPVDKPEKDLQQFLCDNWKELFPQYTFIAQEFKLQGTVHASGSSGRIDILAYNPATKRFVFFELKKNYDKNIGHQAANYRHYIKKNFPTVYVEALQQYKAELPAKPEVDGKEIEMILVAKQFTPLLVEQAETESLVTLIEYDWFENDMLLDYVHNAPGIKQESTGSTDENALAVMTWEEVVNTFIKQPYRAKYFAISPDTKEHIGELRLLANGIPAEKRKVAVQNWLNQREKQLEQDSAT